jgi:O-antigen ligase
MLLFAAWTFGGNIEWARRALSWWGTLGIVILIAALWQDDSPTRRRRALLWLLPWALFVTLVLVSCLNPSFRNQSLDGQEMSIHVGEAHPLLPSTTQPVKTLHELWFCASVYLSCFNLVLAVQRRRSLRVLLALVCASTLLLSIFGTLQKLAGKDLYFGTAETPNRRFFATFIYNNHWGAFMILSAALAFGLLFYFTQHHRGRDFWHSPAPSMILGIFLILATAPVSASRAATAMSILLLAGAAVHAVATIVTHRRVERQSAKPAVALLLVLLLSGGAAATWLGWNSIRERVGDTREQLQGSTLFDSRLALYRDTWELARQKPWFGWGLESYGTAFQLIRPRPLAAKRQYESSYVEAHSDWLQSIAETGFVGTILVMLMAILPLSTLRWRDLRQALVAYPLAGCGLITLYAWIEFPFGNGAVLIAFWLSFFAAIRYAQLSASAGNSA